MYCQILNLISLLEYQNKHWIWTEFEGNFRFWRLVFWRWPQTFFSFCLVNVKQTLLIFWQCLIWCIFSIFFNVGFRVSLKFEGLRSTTISFKNNADLDDILMIGSHLLFRGANTREKIKLGFTLILFIHKDRDVSY